MGNHPADKILGCLFESKGTRTVHRQINGRVVMEARRAHDRAAANEPVEWMLTEFLFPVCRRKLAASLTLAYLQRQW